MGYAVLTIKKPKGNDAGTTAHIERKVQPTNADPKRKHLNKEFIKFPEGVANRTQAIQHRIVNAGIKRKISHNQVRVLQVMLTAADIDMHRIEAEGRLDDWCKDNLEWLWETFGKENVVSAYLHRDETSAHMHASVVPIVTGEPRKAREREKSNDPGKRTYRKKPASTVRLCCDEVMSRVKLVEYQDTYAEKMQKYGLIRGVRGSDAKNISNQQYYRDLHLKNEKLKKNIEQLLQTEAFKREEVEQLQLEQQQVQAELKKVKRELKTEKFKGSVADAGSAVMDTINSALGTSKVKRQQQEIDGLKAENKELRNQVSGLNQNITDIMQENEKSIGELNARIQNIYHWLPDAPLLISIGDQCKRIGFTGEQARELINMRPVLFSGQLYSQEYKRNFHAEKVTAELARNPKDASRFQLLIDKLDIVNWFRSKVDDFLQKRGIKIPDKKQAPARLKVKR